MGESPMSPPAARSCRALEAAISSTSVVLKVAPCRHGMGKTVVFAAPPECVVSP